MPPIARLQLTALDCPDPEALATYYGAITGWPVGDLDAGEQAVLVVTSR